MRLSPWALSVMLGRLLARLTTLQPGDGPLIRLVRQWLSVVAWLLEFEPTWFGEFGLGLGVMFWGVGAMLTDDMQVTGWSYALPIAGAIGGLARCVVLLRLWYEVRVMLAALSAALWAWLWLGLTTRHGILPLPGLLIGAFAIDLLTAAKFSVPCARELRDEYLARVRGG